MSLRFFLACEEPARLLTTLRSRCRLPSSGAAVPSPYALAWLERRVGPAAGSRC